MGLLSTACLVVATLSVPARGGVSYPDCASGPLKLNLVCDTKAAPEARAKALVTAMANRDKLNNLVNNSPGFRSLGLAAYQWWNEALHGVAHNRGITWAQGSGAFSSATQFPQAITTGASFDDSLVELIGTTIGTEARAFANAGRAHLDFWTPNVNPFRDPRWGRGHETPGEDAFRNKRWAAAFVRGMQGNASTHRVVATCKHYAAYDLEAGPGGVTRFNFDAKVSLQDLAEYYLPPFAQCARDSKVGSIMCSYNAVNGVPACANAYLMDTILRKHWGWTDDNQYVVSDCDAVYYLGSASGGHRYKASYAAAIGAALEAGCDNMCWASGGTAPDASAAFSARAFSQATLDKAMARQYQGLVRSGLFDGPTGNYMQLKAADVNTAAAKALALRAAEEGMVLLRNEGGLLPLTEKTPLAMVGFWAGKADAMLGGYSGTPPFNHDPVAAAKTLGWTVTTGTDSGATAAAQNAKVIVYFGGLDNTVEKESGDRSGIAWPASQLSTIQRLAQLGKPVVVVKLGTHVDDTPLLSLPNVKAILWAGYPGQDGGTAVMNILTGATAPAGRLPITMYPAAYTSQAPVTNMALRPSGTYPGRTYRWYDKAVFPFGFGLHYTNFTTAPGPFPATLSIQALLAGCTAPFPDLCPLPPLSVTVANTGARASDFVALAFVVGANGPPPHPLKTLAAYARLGGVAGGQSREARLEWTLGNVARVDAKGNMVLYPGAYTVLLDQPAGGNLSFVLTGQEAVLETWPQPS